MINALKLWRLRRELRSSIKSYSKYIAGAKGEEREIRISEAMNDEDIRRDKLLCLRSLFLQEKADDLGLPVPPLEDKDAWEHGFVPGTVHLNKRAQMLLQQAIRREQRERWDVLAFVLKEIVTPVIGVLGAVMGLLSLIHIFHSG